MKNLSGHFRNSFQINNARPRGSHRHRHLSRGTTASSPVRPSTRPPQCTVTIYYSNVSEMPSIKFANSICIFCQHHFGFLLPFSGLHTNPHTILSQPTFRSRRTTGPDRTRASGLSHARLPFVFILSHIIADIAILTLATVCTGSHVTVVSILYESWTWRTNEMERLLCRGTLFIAALPHYGIFNIRNV